MTATPNSTGSHQTVLALYLRLNIKIKSPCNKEAVDDLLEAVLQHDGVVVVCWQHECLAKLVQELVDDIGLVWPSARYDLIWSLDSSGRKRQVLVRRGQPKAARGGRRTGLRRFRVRRHVTRIAGVELPSALSGIRRHWTSVGAVAWAQTALHFETYNAAGTPGSENTTVAT